MAFEREYVILQQRVPLYTNIADVDGCKGRLSAHLDVYPTPRIGWEFEVLGQKHSVSRLPTQLGQRVGSLRGHNFTVHDPLLAGLSYSSDNSHRVLRGYAPQAVFGSLDVASHFFRFYLPNTVFQERNLTGQQFIVARREEGRNRRLLASGDAGRSMEVPLDSKWKIRLEVGQEALDWMKADQSSVGTFLTTVGTLYDVASRRRRRRANSPVLTLRAALAKLGAVSLLLSYANGGYLGPLLVQAFRNQNGSTTSVAAAAHSYHTTPFEQLGTSWVALDSDLPSFLGCFQTFQRMMATSAWESSFALVLSWYFQVTSGPKAWPIIANGAGAALERLSYTILVLEETDGAKQQKAELLFDLDPRQQNQARKTWQIGHSYGNSLSITGKRLQLLLERIGLTAARGYTDINDVMPFLDVRNHATHPKPGAIPVAQIERLLRRAVQWIDEVLLWRLGYSGKYLDRPQVSGTSIGHRYDLGLRDASW